MAILSSYLLSENGLEATYTYEDGEVTATARDEVSEITPIQWISALDKVELWCKSIDLIEGSQIHFALDLISEELEYDGEAFKTHVITGDADLEVEYDMTEGVITIAARGGYTIPYGAFKYRLYKQKQLRYLMGLLGV